MQTTTNFSSAAKTIGVELFTPAGTPNGGAIVLAYGSDGFVDNAHGPWATMMRGYAADLSGRGFTAVIPDYFQRTGTHPGDIDYDNGGSRQIWLHRNEWQATLGDAVAYTQTLPGISRSRIGLLGFSLGGHLCLRVRSSAKVLVEFFAPILDGLGPDRVPLMAQIHHGRGDKLVDFDDNAKRIDQELRASGATCELWGYDGAKHGFAGEDAANTKARTLSKTRAIDFFTAHL